MKYIAMWGEQKRGAIHYHVIFFDFQYIAKETLQVIWERGFIKINQIDVNSKENQRRYLSKYFDKDLELKGYKKKAFFKSKNLKMPFIRKLILTNDILQNLLQENIIFQKEYTRKVYDEKAILIDSYPLKDSKVTYIKIKRGEI